jgi:hypothetical protein
MEKPAGQNTGPKRHISDDEVKLEKEFRKFKKEPAAVRKNHLVSRAKELQDQYELDKKDWWPMKNDSYKRDDAKLYDTLKKETKIKEQELRATNTQILRWNTLVEKSKTRLLQCGPPMCECIQGLQEKLDSSRD